MDEHLPSEGRRRVVIENLQPRFEDGAFPLKRIVHDPVTVTVDIFTDGHDHLVSLLRYRADEKQTWKEKPLEPQGNDIWRAELNIDRIGRWQFCAIAWVDHFVTWRYDLTKRAAAGQDLAIEFQIGANLIAPAVERAKAKYPDDAKFLAEQVELLRSDRPQHERTEIALGHQLELLMIKHADRALATTSKVQEILVDRPKARFSTWYELFPRSCGEPGKHGTFRDVIAKLPAIAEMGFDVLYFPPIHPIGDSFRKGKNNSTTAQPDDVGSPWAIGNTDGGHDGLHSQLGTLEDFQALRHAAEKLGIELALDLAYQCAPEHPYVKEHPEWFKQRPDGTIQYAENPPKKYQDIYPFDFETPAWQSLWRELKRVVDYWVTQGIKIFRVDNPHTKAFPFWEWMVPEVKKSAPEVLFLSEAFTRPRVRYRLAKLGFSQSYTYFTWRTNKAEIMEYFGEIAKPPVNQFFRPNLWPNTPDILHASLQHGGRPSFMIRLILAATLGANYGMYGPAYELCDGEPREPNSEEYLDSEKYQLKNWAWDHPDSLRPLITTLNRARREHPALQLDDTLQFHPTNHDAVLAYSKHPRDGRDLILVVINLDPFHAHEATVEWDPKLLGRHLPMDYEVRDLLSGQNHTWHGHTATVVLEPEHPAQVLHVG
jgi:starch synthase (maltosyl-transferring)